jgi:adenine-specific DNA methylase
LNETICNDIEDFSEVLSKTSAENMKEIYVDLWTMLKQESIGKKGKDIFDLLIRRTNEYKKVNKENTFESSMFKEEEINESGD